MSQAGGYEGFRAAGVRLSEEQLPHLQSHRTELLGESITGIHAFDKAHAVMLTEQHILSREQGRALLGGLRAMEAEGMVAARVRAQGGMHSGEHYLTDRLGGDLGGRIHLGRSSGDLIEVARRLTIRDHLNQLLPALLDLRAALLDLAAAHVETVMPGYTHGQHAQPTTFAHWATMFERAFARDTQRWLSFHARLNLSPAGAAIMTGSDFPVDRARVAELLGFDAPLPHTLDAIMSHDLEMECAAHAAVAAASLGRLADDLFLWSTSEFAFVELPDRYCGTSSIMPQKKNPDGLEDIKSVAVQAQAALTAVVSAEKGPTGFPILERRYSQRVIWDVLAALTVRVGDAAALMPDLDVRAERMHVSAGAHWAQVTDLAAALVREHDLDWRSAHQIVGAFVRRGIDAGLTPGTVDVETLETAAQEITGRRIGIDPTAFAAAMDAAAFVARRTLIGGPAPEAVRREAATFAHELDTDRASVGHLAEQARLARERLEAAIDAQLG